MSVSTWLAMWCLTWSAQLLVERIRRLVFAGLVLACLPFASFGGSSMHAVVFAGLVLAWE